MSAHTLSLKYQLAELRARRVTATPSWKEEAAAAPNKKGRGSSAPCGPRFRHHRSAFSVAASQPGPAFLPSTHLCSNPAPKAVLLTIWSFGGVYANHPRPLPLSPALSARARRDDTMWLSLSSPVPPGSTTRGGRIHLALSRFPRAQGPVCTLQPEGGALRTKSARPGRRGPASRRGRVSRPPHGAGQLGENGFPRRPGASEKASDVGFLTAPSPERGRGALGGGPTAPRTRHQLRALAGGGAATSLPDPASSGERLGCGCLGYPGARRGGTGRGGRTASARRREQGEEKSLPKCGEGNVPLRSPRGW